MKKCCACKIEKILEEFGLDKCRYDGRQTVCRTCVVQKHKNNPLKNMYSDAKRRAKRKGIEFSIKPEDLVLPKVCPILQIPLFVSGAKCTNNSPSIDRIDNNKGYIKGNVVIVSFKANTIKSNSTIEELEKVLKFYKEYNNSI